MNTTGMRAGRMTAETTPIQLAPFAQTSSLALSPEDLRMRVHIDAHQARLLRQAAIDRLVGEPRGPAIAHPGFARRLRRRLGRAIIGFGRSIEGAGRETGAAAI